MFALICDRNDHCWDLFFKGTNFYILYVYFRVLSSNQGPDAGGVGLRIKKNSISRTTYGQKLIFCNMHIGHCHDNFQFFFEDFCNSTE